MAANEPISKTVACIFDVEEALFDFDLGNLSGPELPGIASMIKVMFDAIIDLLLYALEPLKFILNGDIPGLTNWLIPYSTGFIGAMYDLFMNKIWKKFELGLKVNLPPFSIDLGIISIPLPGIDTGLPSPPGWIFQIPNYILFLIGLLIFPFKIIYEIILGLLQFEFPAINFDFFKKIWDLIAAGLGLPFNAKVPILKFGNCMLNQLLGIVPEGIPSTSVSTDSPIPLSWKNMFNSYPTPEGDDTSVVSKDKLNFKLNSNPSGELYLEGQYTGTDVDIKKKDAFIEGPDKLSFTIEHIEPSPGGFPVSINSLPLFQKAVLKLKCLSLPTDPPKTATLVLKDTDDNVTRFPLVTRSNSIYDLLLENYRLKGGEWDPGINLFGIRNKNERTNVWEDILGVAYYDLATDKWRCKWTRGTTRPGAPRNLNSTEAPGDEKSQNTAKGEADYYYYDFFHKDLFVPGQHGSSQPGKFYNNPALVTNNSTAESMGWREKNGVKSGIYSAKTKLDPQYYRTMNFHTSAPYVSIGVPANGPAPTEINNKSWGCQVVQYHKNFTEMMDIILGHPKPYYHYMLFLRDSVQELWDLLDADLPPIGADSAASSTISPDIQIN